jgi:hypothetical protein
MTTLENITLLSEITTLVNQGVIKPCKTRHRSIRVFEIEVFNRLEYFYIRKDFQKNTSLSSPISIGSYCPKHKWYSNLNSVITESIPALKQLDRFSLLNKEKAVASFNFLLSIH